MNLLEKSDDESALRVQDAIKDLKHAAAEQRDKGGPELLRANILEIWLAVIDRRIQDAQRALERIRVLQIQSAQRTGSPDLDLLEVLIVASDPDADWNSIAGQRDPTSSRRRILERDIVLFGHANLEMARAAQRFGRHQDLEIYAGRWKQVAPQVDNALLHGMWKRLNSKLAFAIFDVGADVEDWMQKGELLEGMNNQQLEICKRYIRHAVDKYGMERIAAETKRDQKTLRTYRDVGSTKLLKQKEVTKTKPAKKSEGKKHLGNNRA